MTTAPAISRFTFDDATHTYTDEIGVVIPSVTQCLKAENFINFDAVPFNILERKRRLGTLVHQAAQMWDEGDELDAFDIPAIVFEYLDGYVNFCEDTDFTPTLIETRKIGSVYGMRYGMCPDRDGILNGEPHVLELKCGASEHAAWGLQLAAYDIGLENSALPPRARRKRVALQLGPQFKRGYDLHPYEDPADYQIWLNCLANTLWKQNKRKLHLEDIPEREAA